VSGQRHDPMGTIPAFDLPSDTPRPTPKRPAPASDRPAWSAYRPKSPVKCDDCMAVLAEARGQGPASLTARWKRKAGDVVRLLCIPHAQAQRERDQPSKLDTRGPK
jgi:hypothetical protein